MNKPFPPGSKQALNRLAFRLSQLQYPLIRAEIERKVREAMQNGKCFDEAILLAGEQADKP